LDITILRQVAVVQYEVCGEFSRDEAPGETLLNINSYDPPVNLAAFRIIDED